MIITDADRILNFLEGKTTDYKGRTYQDILDCSDSKMEECHDQVQWIFPLHEESHFAQVYPMLTPQVIEKCSESELVKSNLKKAKERMEKFWGFHPDRFSRDIQRAWCMPFNHNLLRITRMIRSLRFFGLEDEANESYDRVLEVGNYFDISNVTKAYWWRAAREDIWKTLR